MFTPRNYTKLQKTILFSSFVCSGISLSALPALTASPTPGTVIENQASGSYVDEADNSTKTIVSDQVTVIVAEVAGITVTANGTTGTPNPGATIYSSFIITNVGNDPTQFFIPNLANLTGNATQASNIEITGYNLNGTTPVLIATPIVVPNGGGQTGSNGTVAGLLNGSNGTGIIQPGGSVTVRVPVKINTTAVNNDLIVVQLGDTPDSASTTTPKAQLQNQPFVVGSNDVYTVDNPDSLETSAGVPIDGDATFHRQEAAALQSTLVIGNALSCSTIYGITSDATNTLLKSFDPTNGTVSSVATMGAAVGAYTLGIDPVSGRAYYVANSGPARYHIFTYDPISNVTTDTGVSVPISSPLAALQLGFDQTGLGYIVDQNFNAWSFTATNSPVVTSLGVVGGMSGYNGGDIAFDRSNNGWTVSRNTTNGNYALFRITKSGNTLTATNLGYLQEGGVTLTNGANIGSIAFDPVGNLYIIRSSDGHSWKINPQTLQATTIAASLVNNGNGISDLATCSIPTFAAIIVSGNVFYDQDADLTINGTDAGTNAGSSTLTVYAIDTNGKVVDKTLVAANGSYTLSKVPQNSSVKLRLSIDETVAIGATAPATPSIPSSWYHTGENLNGTLDPAIATLGDIALTTATANLSNENFGIRQATTITADPLPTVCSTDYRTALNTGISAAGGQLATGVNDLNWTAEWIAGPATATFGTPYAPPRPVGPMPAVVVGNLASGAWVNEPSNARWISYPFRLSVNSNGNHNNADLDVKNGEDGSGISIVGTSDTVRLKFTAQVSLPSNASTTTISLPIGVAMDNQFVSVKVNGVENLSPVPNPANPQATNYRAFTNVNLTQGWQAGVNTIELILDSGPPQAGFLLAVNAATTQTCATGNNLSGTVFEDPNYGGGAGRKLSTTSTSPRSGATVELYKSDGTYISSTTTSSVAGSIGQYTFSNVAAGDYYVRVVNSTVTSSRTGYVSTLLPVQTFRVDDSTGTPADDINRVGGEKPSVADTGAAAAGAVLDTTNFTFTTGKGNATTGGQAQSIAPVKVGSSAVTGIDFGYNFDTIVNTNDSGQGSLRQFIDNSNALSNTGLDQVPNPNPVSGTTAVDPAPGEETSIFMIPVAALTSNVGIITITTQLPAITDTFTTINGLTQTADIGNTNSGQQGSGGTVGTDGLTLSTVNKPEIQIVGNNTMNNGLTVQGANTTIRGIAINGFGNSVTNGNIVVDTNVSSTLIEKNFIGTTAASFSVPTSRTKGDNIILQSGANNGIVQNNLIGYAELFGVLGIASNQGWTIENNEIRDNSFNDPSKDGVSFESGSTNNLVRGNLIFSQGGNGVDSWNGGGTLTIENNTITGNGQGSTTGLGETPGVRLYGVGNKVYRNIINANYGAGVMVTAGSTNNTISQNSIYANGTIAAMNGGAASNQIGIDLLTTSDNQTQGTFNYVSANNGVVAGVANNSMDYPVIISSSLLGTSLKVSGFIGTSAAGNTAFANATLEFFISEGTNANQGEVIINDGKSKSHGEGKTYIGFCTADANGLFGTVSKPCLLSNVPAALTNPNNITATATDSAGNTSEFSSIPSASNPNVLLVKRITAINGDRIKNPNDNTPLNIFVDDTTSSKAAEDNNSNWVTNYLKGAINAGKVKPSDEIEYTIYFLSAGNASASGVRICDRLEPNQTFQPKGYGTGTGIQLQLGTSPVIDLTNINDASDRTQFIPAGATVPTNCNITGTNTDGTIIVDVTGAAGTGNPTLTALPEATGAGTPNDSYGFFRFIIKVNP